MACDLHNHSKFSDGSYTPTELVLEAKKLNLSAIALTDHNTVAGLPEFMAAGKEYGVNTVPGVEITTAINGNGNEFHIVALYVDESHWDRVTEFCSIILKWKKESNIKTISELQKAGYNISYDSVFDFAKNDNLNRNNIAQYLVHTNQIASTNEAFAFGGILADDSPYYIKCTEKIDTIKAIKFINSIGAVSVWAHPYFDYNPEDVEKFAKLFTENGLNAMETRYSTYKDEENVLASEVAKKNGLLSSGGSDCHGKNKEGIYLGIGTGNLCVPDEFAVILQNSIK